MAVTSVSSATSDTQILGPGSREGFTIVNTDANRLYVLLDSGVSSTSNYSFYLETGDVYECATEKCYTGEIRGIWAGDGSGAAIVTTWGV